MSDFASELINPLQIGSYGEPARLQIKRPLRVQNRADPYLNRMIFGTGAQEVLSRVQDAIDTLQEQRQGAMSMATRGMVMQGFGGLGDAAPYSEAIAAGANMVSTVTNAIVNASKPSPEAYKMMERMMNETAPSTVTPPQAALSQAQVMALIQQAMAMSRTPPALAPTPMFQAPTAGPTYIPPPSQPCTPGKVYGPTYNICFDPSQYANEQDAWSGRGIPQAQQQAAAAPTAAGVARRGKGGGGAHARVRARRSLHGTTIGGIFMPSLFESGMGAAGGESKGYGTALLLGLGAAAAAAGAAMYATR